MIEHHAKKIRVVVQWDILTLDDLSKRPEGFFFVHTLQQSSCYTVHTLAINSTWISQNISAKYIPQRNNKLINFFFLLVRICPSQIYFNLMRRWIRVVNPTCLERFVVSWVVNHLSLCSSRLQP